MGRKVSIAHAATRLRRNRRTLENWIARRLIGLYETAEGELVVDLDEIEMALRLYPRKMHDGRKVHGVKPVPLPPVPAGGEA